MPVERSDLAIDYFVAGTVSLLDRLFEILGFEVVVDALRESVENILDIGIAKSIYFEIELLRLMAEHEGQKARDALGETLIHRAEILERKVRTRES